mgnify:CR=1 FL=1
MGRELVAHDAEHHDGREAIQKPDELRNEGLGVLDLRRVSLGRHRRIQRVFPDRLRESC